MNRLKQYFNEKVIKYVDKKVILKYFLLLFFFIIFFITGLFNIIVEETNILLVLAFLVIGISGGLFFGSVQKLTWSEGKIINKSDIIGGIISTVYYIVVIFHRKLFANWFIGQQVAELSIWFSVGLIMGQFFMLDRKLRKTGNEYAKYKNGIQMFKKDKNNKK